MSHPASHIRATETWIETPTLTIAASGTAFACRRLGPAQGILVDHGSLISTISISP